MPNFQKLNYLNTIPIIGSQLSMITKNDIYCFLRPNVNIIISVIFLAGLFSTKHFAFSIPVIAGLIVTNLLCIAGQTINDYFDYESDKKSKDLYRFPVARGAISLQFAGNFTFALLMSSFVLGYLFLNFNSFLLTILGVFWLIAYSTPPIRIKEKTLIDSLWNGFGYGVIPFFYAATIVSAQINPDMILLSIVPFSISVMGHMLLAVPDIQTDSKNKFKTTPVVFGKLRVLDIATALLGVSGIIIIYLLLTGFLNYLAIISVAAGLLAAYQHKSMKKEDVRKRFNILTLVYFAGGIAFLFSIL